MSVLNGAAAGSSTQPSPTLFVTNLDDKLKKPDLKRVLYQLFSAHGKVLDVVVMKGTQLRGSAHIVFRDLQGATQAMRWLDGSGLLGREMRISYAKGRSHATIKQEAGDEVLYQVKMGIKDPDTLQDIVGGGKSKMVVSSAQASNIARKKAEEAEAKKRQRAEEGGSDEEEEEEEEDGPSEPKKLKTNGKAPTEADDDEDSAMEEDSDEEPAPPTAAAAAVAAAGTAPIAPGEEPGPVLFLEGLPGEVTEDMMAVLFQQYPGFQSVRLVPGRQGIAFVQYDTTAQSGVAKTALDGFQLAPGVEMAVGFARRS